MRRALAAALLLAPGICAADSSDYSTPRHFAVELKAGPYRPDVDSQPGLAGTPYRDTFGNGDLVFSGFEFDWQILVTDVLSLGIGAGAGFFQAYAKARFEDCAGPLADCTSSEYTVLNVIPFSAQAVLRLDVLPQLAGIPLTPYGKAGLDRWLWWILNGHGTSRVEGEKAAGWTNGWHLAGGLMLLLDFFEPGAATKLDQESGINNSYLFAEILLARIDGFGDGDSLVLSDATWNAGLALEF